jgi:chemotaxis protein methyltransferase CheR
MGDFASAASLSDADFTYFVSMLRKQSGIVLASHKRTMVVSRLSRRLRELNLKTYAEYIKLLESQEGVLERQNCVNALTTNLTRFFREQHHFDHFEKWIDARYRDYRRNDPLRIWSAGCSTGQEPYSIAFGMHQAQLRAHSIVDSKILATDIDTNVLNKAASGIYGINELEGIHKKYYEHLTFDKEEKPTNFIIAREVRERIAFKYLNLHDAWPMKGKFDAIFCRNVLIYFDKPTQQLIFNRFVNMLKPGGYLYIGHSETIPSVSHEIRFLGQTTYQKNS